METKDPMYSALGRTALVLPAQGPPEAQHIEASPRESPVVAREAEADGASFPNPLGARVGAPKLLHRCLVLHLHVDPKTSGA